MRTLNIMGVQFTVEEVECVSKDELRKGEVNYLTGEIKLDKSMPDGMKNQVLMHEIMHVILDLLGYDELAADEQKVQGIATALHQVFAAQTIFSS